MAREGLLLAVCRLCLAITELQHFAKQLPSDSQELATITDCAEALCAVAKLTVEAPRESRDGSSSESQTQGESSRGGRQSSGR